MTVADAAGEPQVDVVVVGAGIAGLAAAHRLTSSGLSVLVLERDDHIGGRIQTEHKPGLYLEHGGIFHTEGYAAMRGLLAELGLADKVKATDSGFYSAVRHEGRWAHVDYGSVLGPLRYGALTWGDRLSVLRAALPALIARPSDLGDLTTLARLDTRSAADGLSPRASRYFTAGPHEFLWGVPSRSLSFAMLAMQLHMYKGELRELSGGIGQLTDALAAGLPVRTGQAVTRVESTADAVVVHLTADSAPVRARAAVLACPADAAAALWPDAPEPVRTHLEAVEYSRIDYVYLRTREPLRVRDGERPVGMEIVTEAEAGRTATGTIGGVYYANDWADDGGLLLVTASLTAHAEDLDDNTLAERLQADVESLHPEWVGQVTERVVIRHPYYTPTVSPGSVRRMAAARAHLPAGRVDVAGDHMTAPWVEGAVRSGQLAAERITSILRH